MRQANNERKVEIPIYIGVGEIVVSKNPNNVLVTSLGSCVAVIMLAPGICGAGMAHVALPSSSVNVEQSRAKPGYYADTGIPRLLAAMDKLHGGKRGRLLVKLVGGANIMDPNSTFDIGKRNALAIKKILWENRLGVLVEDIGEDISRNVRVRVDTGQVIVKTLGKERVIL
ncbi:MAG: chemotaxis protein CheD [Deltaproteobacteria bacterium]|jgi:chemotaxis protein CheD|nr:MAG: chemotaxis protein CheD [Deltaproteobacteria bacterium]